MCIVFCYIISLSANPTKWSKIMLDHFEGLALKGLYLLNTLIFIRNVSANMYIWHVQPIFYQVVGATLLYLIGYMSFSLALYILSTAFMLKFFLLNLGKQIYLKIYICKIYIYMYIFVCLCSIYYACYIHYIVRSIYIYIYIYTYIVNDPTL